MKIILNAMVEQGDTLRSIIDEVYGDGDARMIWEFNRNVMPSPMQLPQPGTMIRLPVDPKARSGAPALEALRAPHVSDEALAGSSTILGAGGPSDPPEAVEGSRADLAQRDALTPQEGLLTTEAPPATTVRQKPLGSA